MFEPSPTGSLESIQLRPIPPGASWSPVVGREVQALLSKKGLEEAEARRVESETCRILSRCVSPSERSIHRTGLIVGFVQSGKTLSFTALTALARDNRYRLVIVLGGTTTNVIDQSLKRLTDDLDIEGHGQRIWTLLANPTDNSKDEVSRALRSWNEYSDRPERCRTVLIVVMKHYTHLDNLSRLLSNCALSNVSALVIDDEGDQAGLNTKVSKNDESTTYSRIRSLRKVLPTHTYLLYTATPQAPLLISRIDMLSPQFADLIEPGPAYVGGKDLFSEEPSEYPSPHIEIIPGTELPDADVRDTIPRSLESALRLFYVGVAAGIDGNTPGSNRSMMIHPSQLRDYHQKFLGWVRDTKTTWLNLLKAPPQSPDRCELMDSFRAAYYDLRNTTRDLPSFEEIERNLYYAIDDTEIKEINSREGRIPIIPWKRYYSFILVGGMGLDRGFTVEGLTVTYMPRSAGMGHADTVQQRGRFFGYKRSYLGLIRIFLETSVEAAFRNYVKHEQRMRRSLIKHRDSGKPLTDWRRAFFLDRSMTPTRRSVLSLEYMRNRGREWTYPKTPHASEILEKNRVTLQSFLRDHPANFLEDPGDEARTEDQRHLLASFDLSSVYRDLLVPILAVRDDLLDHIHVLLQIEAALEEHPEDKPPLLCEVYRMCRGAPRERGLGEDGEIKSLLQGENRNTGYPGDRAIRHQQRVTVQIHTLDLRNEGKDGQRNGPFVVRGVPALAIAIPKAMRADTLIEDDDE